MRTIVAASLALAMAASANVAQAVEIAPNAYKSLQPFERFARGEGEGVAYRYVPRTVADLVALMRDKVLAKKEMRVPCEVLVQQMKEGHTGLPFEGCEGTAAAIEHDNDFTIAACSDEMFRRDNYLTVTNQDGSAWGVWHRSCLKDEQVLVYKGRPIMSLTCLNVAIPASPPPVAQKKPAVPDKPLERGKPRFVIGACPDVYTLEVKVHENRAFYLPGVEQTHAQEERDVIFIGRQHVSRTHGAQLRRSLADGGHKHSWTPTDFRVSLIMTSEIRTGVADIIKEQPVADITVTGSREIDFSSAEIDEWDAIRVVAVRGEEVRSPPRFAGTGQHEMRFFNKLPGTQHGEWDNPLQKQCFKTEHWIEQPQTVRKQ